MGYFYFILLLMRFFYGIGVVLCFQSYCASFPQPDPKLAKHNWNIKYHPDFISQLFSIVTEMPLKMSLSSKDA